MNQKLYVSLLSTFFVGGLQAMAPVPANGALHAVIASGMSRFLPQYVQEQQVSQVAMPQVQLSDGILKNVTSVVQMESQGLDMVSFMPIQKPRVVSYAGFRGLGAPTRVLYQQKTRDEGVYKKAYDEAYAELKKSRDSEKTLKKLRVKYHPDRCKGDHSGAEAVIDANNKLFASKNNKVNSEFADFYRDLGAQRLKELLCKNSILKSILRWGLPEKELLWSQRELLIEELEQFIKNHFELINMARSDDKKFDPNKRYRDTRETMLIINAHQETQKALLQLYPELRHRINLHFNLAIGIIAALHQNGGKPFGVYFAKEFYEEAQYEVFLKVRIFLKWFVLFAGYSTYKVGSKVYRYLTRSTQPVVDKQTLEKPNSEQVEAEEELFMPA